jgi:hypothetical protein
MSLQQPYRTIIVSDAGFCFLSGCKIVQFSDFLLVYFRLLEAKKGVGKLTRRKSYQTTAKATEPDAGVLLRHVLHKFRAFSRRICVKIGDLWGERSGGRPFLMPKRAHPPKLKAAMLGKELMKYRKEQPTKTDTTNEATMNPSTRHSKGMTGGSLQS